MCTYNVDRLIGLKIILVDENSAFSTALKKLLEMQFKCEVIAVVSDGDALLSLPTLIRADVVFMDLSLPQLNTYKAMEEINWQYPNLKVLAITEIYESVYLRKLIENGFKGCLIKRNLNENIGIALDRILDNKLYFPTEFILKEK
jgi:DNA-binding NarL/FixJ family response regulator